MSPWPFVISAYSVAVCLTVGLLARAYLSMRRAEAAAVNLNRK